MNEQEKKHDMRQDNLRNLQTVMDSVTIALEAIKPAIRQRHFIVGMKPHPDHGKCSAAPNGSFEDKGDLYGMLIRAESALLLLQQATEQVQYDTMDNQ